MHVSRSVPVGGVAHDEFNQLKDEERLLALWVPCVLRFTAN